MRLRDQIIAGACSGWISILGLGVYFAQSARPSRLGVIRDRAVDGHAPSALGAQDAPSRLAKAAPLTGERLGANPASPGFALDPRQDGHGVESAITRNRARRVVDLTQGVRSVPSPEKTKAMLREPGRGHYSQGFEGGAAWSGLLVNQPVKLNEAGTHPPTGGEDTQRLALAGTRSPEPALVIAGIKPGRHLQTLATSAAELCGVPPALFHSLISKESSWRPHVISLAGAVGLAQVKPSTAREISLTLDVRDPWQNLVAGACYLRRQFDRFGTWRKALHAYRLGPNALVTRTAREYASDIITGSAQ